MGDIECTLWPGVVDARPVVRVNDAGLLEPYILFAHPDPGIARDYAGYRTANRDKLRRYWLEIVIGIK